MDLEYNAAREDSTDKDREKALKDFEPEIQERAAGNCCCRSPKEQDPLYAELDNYISSFADEEGILIRVLHHAQNLFGFLSREVQMHIAKRLGLSLAEVYGVVSFYSYFSIEPKAQFTVEVCMGTACYVKGAQGIIAALEKELGIKTGQISKDKVFGLKVSRCIGACSLAPVMIVGGNVHGRLKPEMVKDILNSYRQKAAAAPGAGSLIVDAGKMKKEEAAHSSTTTM